MHLSLAVHAALMLIISRMSRWSLLSLTDGEAKLFISRVSCRLPNMFTVVHLQEVTLSRSDANILALVTMRNVADLGRNVEDSK